MTFYIQHDEDQLHCGIIMLCKHFPDVIHHHNPWTRGKIFVKFHSDTELVAQSEVRFYFIHTWQYSDNMLPLWQELRIPSANTI